MLLLVGGIATASAQASVFGLKPIDLGDGMSISGTVTTDGTIGLLGPQNLTRWSLAVTMVSDYIYTPATAPGRAASMVAVDGQKLTIGTSLDGFADGGFLGFRRPYPAEYGVSLADFSGAWLSGGQSAYVAGGAFGFLELNQPDASSYVAAQADAASPNLFTLRPLDFGGGVNMTGTITTDGTLGALVANNLIDWNIRVRETTMWNFNEKSLGVLYCDGVTTDGQTLTVANPDGALAFGVSNRGEVTMVQLADFTDQSPPGGQAGFINPLIYQITSPLSNDASYVVATAIPEPAQTAAVTGLALGLFALLARSLRK